MGSSFPLQLTRFIGREREINDATRALSEARLLTLTGPGGCGKTRLAIAVATLVKDEYENGAVWVDLAPISDESLLSQAVAKALDVKEQPSRSARESLVDFLDEKQILLILDNCEHLREGCRRLVTTLLAVTSISILTTSREQLDVSGERLFPVPPLSLPSRGYQLDDLAGIGQFEAIQLFDERAQLVLPTFALTADNANTIINICYQLDGLPLAIELAAARVNVLTVDQIAARLDNRFKLLKSDQRSVIDQRHQTLRAAIDWSHDLLTAREQLLLRRLSVFAGGCSLDEAEMVCSGDGIKREQMLDLLSSLVNKSLVSAITLQRSEARYSLLETIRQYARERLRAAREWSRLRDRHLKCFLQLTTEIEPRLWEEDQKLWLNRLADAYDNIRAALSSTLYIQVE